MIVYVTDQPWPPQPEVLDAAATEGADQIVHADQGYPDWLPLHQLGVQTIDPAPPPVPASVTPLQMRKAIRQLGLKPSVDALIATLDEEIVEAWEYATEILRSNPLIAMAASALEMDAGQTDDLFRLAKTFA